MCGHGPHVHVRVAVQRGGVWALSRACFYNTHARVAPPDEMPQRVHSFGRARGSKNGGVFATVGGAAHNGASQTAKVRGAAPRCQNSSNIALRRPEQAVLQRRATESVRDLEQIGWARPSAAAGAQHKRRANLRAANTCNL